MLRCLFICILSVVITSCSFFTIHKRTIEQGNIFTQSEINQLHPGMNRSEVIAILGNPVLSTTFSPNELIYVYTYNDHKNPTIKKYLICQFVNDRLNQIKAR